MATVLGKPGESGAPASPTIEQIMAEVNKNIDAKLGAKLDDFKKTALPEVIKAHIDPLNSQLTTINESLGKLVTQQDPNSGGTPPAKGQTSPEVNAQLRTLTDKVQAQGKTIETLQTAKESAEKRAEETDRHSTIRTALSGLPFVNDKAAETAFSIVVPHVRRLDDNSLVAGVSGDNFPVAAFTKDYLEKEHAYLFKASGATGSGVSNTGGGVRMGAKVDVNSIKVGMKAEDRAAAVEAINAALAGSAG